MKTAVEFRDLDGSYLLLRPLDDIRCLVLDSNVAQRGELLYKEERLTWSEAARDLGGYTRVAPSELLAAADLPRRESMDYRHLILGTTEQSESDPGHLLKDAGLSSDRDLEDPRASLLRLALHYRRAHARRGSAPSRCRCPGFSPEGDLKAGRFHALISIALITRTLPSLSRMLGAIRNAAEARAAAASS